MKSFLLLCSLFFITDAMAVCSSPIARTNFAVREVLTSARLNNELNTVYSRSNELPGDCITDGTIHGNKLITGSVDISKVNYLVATVSDMKTNGSSGGTFTDGAWRTRDLNTEVDPNSIVSIASNRFTLGAGTYLLEAFAPACSVGAHNLRIYNYTASASISLGTNQKSGSGECNTANVVGIATISVTSSFEIQHYGTDEVTITGFGTANTDLADEEVYTVVKITKIK